MSTYVDQMKIGDQITVSLPFGRFNYLGRNIVRIKELYTCFYLGITLFLSESMITSILLEEELE